MTDRIEPAPDSTVPPHLYKYRSLRDPTKTYVRDLIVSQRLYFPTPRELNDPFEFRPVLDLNATERERRAYIRRAVAASQPRANNRQERLRRARELDTSEFPKKVAASFRKTMDALGVYSLSAKPLDVLMWPHYADNHAGICVRFDTFALAHADYTPMWVIYCRERPICNPVTDDPLPILMKAARTKGLPWSYEEEWRILLRERGSGLVTIMQPVVSGVILGARISDADRNEVLGWVASCRRPMEAFQARFHDEDYALVADRLS